MPTYTSNIIGPSLFISPPKSDSLRSGLKFYPWCLFFSPREIFELRGPTGVKFCTMVSTRPNFIMLVQNFGRHAPKTFQGPKTCKIWPNFGQLWKFGGKYLQNRLRYSKSNKYFIYRDSSCIRRNKNGEVWSSNLKIWEGKKRQKIGAIYNNFWVWA